MLTSLCNLQPICKKRLSHDEAHIMIGRKVEVVVALESDGPLTLFQVIFGMISLPSHTLPDRVSKAVYQYQVSILN